MNAAFESIESEQIRRVGLELWSAYENRKSVFLAGNGGSAALANHFACDLSKTCAGATPRDHEHRFIARSLSANLATITAWANDEGYQHIFSEQLRTLAHSGDAFIAISASGNSPNIIKALEQARDMGVVTIGLLGFQGGRAKDLCDYSVHVRSSDYGIVEGMHSVFVHLLTRWLLGKIHEVDVVVQDHLVENLTKAS